MIRTDSARACRADAGLGAERIIPLRVTAEPEEIGLDLSQQGEIMQDTGPSSALPFFAKSA